MNYQNVRIADGLRRKKLLPGITLVLCLFFAVGPTLADIEFEHIGDADPTENGWSRSPAAANVTYGGGESDLTASQCPYPCPYRFVQDLGTGGGQLGAYFQSVNSTQINHAGGWSIRVRVRKVALVEGVAEAPLWSNSIYLRHTPVANQTQEYGLRLGITSDNRMRVQPYPEPPVDLGLANSYHLLEMVFNPATNQVDVLADGVVILADFQGRVLDNFSSNQIRFGSADSGNQGISWWNMVQFITNPDTDGDELSDVDEVAAYGTDPYVSDSDGDGLGDGFEVSFGFNPLVPGEEMLDGDADGLDNLGEYDAGSDPQDADSDDDGLSDGEEVNQYGSNPVETESDGDGLDDIDEVNVHGTSPGRSDTDDDGLIDPAEINTYLTDPTMADSDGDGLLDGQEILNFQTDPLNIDSDFDTLADGFEVRFGFDPLLGGEEGLDGDADGLDNVEEQAAGTSPADPDSDADGLGDGEELNTYGTSPILVDTDGDELRDLFEINNSGFNPLVPGEQLWDQDIDGLNSLAEQAESTDPNNADSDGDGISDGDEVRILMTSPNDADDSGVPIVRDTGLALAVVDAPLYSETSTNATTVPVMSEVYAGSQGQIHRLDQQVPLEVIQGFWDEGWAECKTTRTGSTYHSCANYSVTPSDSICRNGGSINLEAQSISCCQFLGLINTAASWGSCGAFGTATFTLADVEALVAGNQIPNTINIPHGLGDRPTVAPPPIELDVGAEVTHNVSLSAEVVTTIDPQDGGLVNLDYETVATMRSTRSTVAAGETFELVATHNVDVANTWMDTFWPAASVTVGLNMSLDASVDAHYAGLNPNPADENDYQLDVTTNIYSSSTSSEAELFDLRLGAWTGLKMTIMGDAPWAPELYRDLEIHFDPPEPGFGISYEFDTPSACPDANTFTPCNLVLNSPVTFDLLGTRLQLPVGNTPVPEDFNGGARALYVSDPAIVLRNNVDDNGWLSNSAPGRYRPITNISDENSIFDTFIGDQTNLGGDWFRFEVDLDGWATLASSGAFIAGANFQDPAGFFVVELNVLDSDLVYWAGNDQVLTFRPNIVADIVFDKTVTVTGNDDQPIVVDAGIPFTMSVNAGSGEKSRLEVVQPPGGVEIDVSYSFRDNCFDNQTFSLGTFGWRNSLLQMKLQGILGTILGVAELPTEFTAFKYTQQFGEPIEGPPRGGSHMFGGESILDNGGPTVVFGPTPCQGTPDNLTTQIDYAGPSLSVMDLTEDDDADGLPTLLEDTMCSSSLDADSDDDGLHDGIEDSNGNGLVDAGETSPCVADTDGDGLTDGQERGLTSVVPDPDGGGPLLGTLLSAFLPSANPSAITNATDPDTDGDGLDDGEELLVGTDPLAADTDGDTLADGSDNCPTYSNSGQLDYDADGHGNVCDASRHADVTAFGDIAGLHGDESTGPMISVYSSVTGDLGSTIGYLNNKWHGIALGTIGDADQDASADDPAVAMLAVNKDSGKIRVESRRVNDAGFLGSIQFLNQNWRAVDVVVVDDLDGDGDTSDTAIGVLAERFSDGRIQLQLRDFATGALISNTVYLNARWIPIAAAVASRAGLPPVIGVIAHHGDNNKRTMQSRVAGTGAFDRNIKFLGSTWDYKDISVNHDANGDGTNDDPAWMVLATRPSDDVIRVQSKFVSDGSFDDNIVILNANWEAFRLDAANDIDGNLSGEMVISAIRRADEIRRIHVKDYGSGSTTINIAP